MIRLWALLDKDKTRVLQIKKYLTGLNSSMSKLLIFSFCIFFLPFIVFAYTSPGKPQGFVNDFAGVLKAEEKQNIEIQLGELKKSTGAEVAVVTISSLGDETIESYAVKRFQEWGIGEKGKDNGLLILVALNDREARIEVGYGLEGTVTDLQAGQVVRLVMIPAFKEGKYGHGITGAAKAITDIISKSPEAVVYSGTDTRSPSNPKNDIDFAALFFIVIIILNIMVRFLGKTKSWWLGGVVGGVVGAIIGLIWGFVFAGIGAIVILTILGLIFDYFVSKHPPGSGGGLWPIIFGGGRGGSGSSGFGGFGGGMSGGGGASGRW